ncbi:MAG: DNA-directed RNA polymerase subunit P [Candidatus Methanolliviera hydrocarbonicum]|uniref:DNA-directed RNA polymerase subunit Rpo12 n=1 Tax=Candidatus Methanolliviera hydrocarbonicum TaxID=2491085 RepID=A0A520KZ52_9EURY|nr:MAG: DNA-directed RNA polymerase subunit P [Candidatus Methanolliviera hydrocarbonicum]
MYRCARCKRGVEIDIYRGIRCPYCGCHIFLKERAVASVKKVKAE